MSTNYQGPTSAIPIAAAAEAVDDIAVETVVHALARDVNYKPHHISPLSSAQNGTTTTQYHVPTIQTHSSVSADAQNARNPQPISMPLHLYRAAQNGNVDFFNKYLQFQDLQQLDGPNQLKEVSIGDNSLLHIVATSSSPYIKGSHPITSYVDFAKEVYRRNKSLLMACNKLKETPLHCASRTGNYTMVCLFISFAEHDHKTAMETLLIANNMHGETALHEAVRAGHKDIVTKLILSEPRLTDIVDADGVSPLYLATMTNAFDIVQVFTREHPSLVSCAGPKGQTALHAAVLEHTGITRELIEWDKSLATKVDDLGSTPLHYAASAGNLATLKLLLDHETSAAYMADKEGLYPIHIAAKCDRSSVIKELIDRFPDSDELLDKNGRNFLHIAIMSGKKCTIFRMHKNLTFLRMINARDYQGNTPLHLAGQRGQFSVVRFLMSQKMVFSSIMNRDGLTPVDLSIRRSEGRLTYTWNKQYHTLRCLLWTGALPSPHRVDHFDEELHITVIDRKKKAEKATNVSRGLGITSVLIATVTFAAIFTMPGGYIADDHVNGGNPILSRKYTFKAFIVADLLGFILSISATSLLVYAGFSGADLKLRLTFTKISTQMIKFATKATVCAFALATYTVLSHANLPISILVCVATFGLLPFSNPSYWGLFLIASPLVKRYGWTGLFNPHFRPQTRARVTVRIGLSYWQKVMIKLLRNILLYMVIFLLALI